MTIHEQIFQSPFATSAFVNWFVFEVGTTGTIQSGYNQMQTGRASAVASSREAHQGGQGMDNQAIRNTWNVQSSGMIKIKVDGGISSDGTAGAAPAVGRNAEGLYLGSSALVIPGLINPTMLEVVACREDQALAEDLGLRKILIYSDCKPLIADMANGEGVFIQLSSRRSDQGHQIMISVILCMKAAD